MQEPLVCSLRSQLPQIRARWAALLHVEPVTTPLGHPDTLVHLIDWTVNEIFQNLAAAPAHRRRAEHRPECPCGRNPLLAYFAAGEQTMREALILAQAAAPDLDSEARDAALDELNHSLHQIARREIEAFCGVCQYRTDIAGAAIASGSGRGHGHAHGRAHFHPAAAILAEKAGLQP